nr:hypothetical protein [Brevibacillus fluminis]
MNRNRLCNVVLSGTLCFSAVLSPFLVSPVAQAASTARITYKLPANPEKYLFLNVQMVSIANPQVAAAMQQQSLYTREDYLTDRDRAGSHIKLQYDDNLKFLSSKKGFLWNIYHFIGIFPPYAPGTVDATDLDRQIANTQSYSEEWYNLRETRAQLEMNARLQPLIAAGYVKPEEIDDGVATKEFVATVLYRMFGDVRPYHGGIDLKDSENTAVRWAVEVGLPGFAVDSKGYLYPETPLSMESGPNAYALEVPYERLFQFITLVLPGRKTPSGWEYYQVKLLPGMSPIRAQDVISVNGKPFNEATDYYTFSSTPEYRNASKAIANYAIPRFAQMLDLARKDAQKPRVWDWSRDLIHDPGFTKEIAAYRKNKSGKNLNTVYQAVRTHYNLSIPQDSAAVIKSVLDHVK